MKRRTWSGSTPVLLAAMIGCGGAPSSDGPAGLGATSNSVTPAAPSGPTPPSADVPALAPEASQAEAAMQQPAAAGAETPVAPTPVAETPAPAPVAPAPVAPAPVAPAPVAPEPVAPEPAPAATPPGGQPAPAPAAVPPSPPVAVPPSPPVAVPPSPPVAVPPSPPAEVEPPEVTPPAPVADMDESGGQLLPQNGNPIHVALDNYKRYLPGDPAGDKLWGDIVASWQFSTGAYPKSGYDHEYKQGVATEAMRAEAEEGRRSLGTLDNGSTITELASLGYTYRNFGDPAHQVAAQKTMDWLLDTQQGTGGWQQWTPARTGSSAYSAHATFNDEGMMRVLISLQKAVRKQDPFDSDIFTEEQLTRAQAAIEKGVDFILKAQIKTGGKLTVWCAQHNMENYQPEGARTFELASKSGQESALIAAFLMSRPQTPEIKAAVEGALSWYNDPEVYVADTKYVRPKSKDGGSPYVSAPGKKMWYRFYELDTNKYFFADRDGVPTYEIQDLGEDRYTGYVWAGDWAKELMAYAAQLGML